MRTTSDVIDLRRRGDDFEVARAAEAEPVSEQLAKHGGRQRPGRARVAAPRRAAWVRVASAVRAGADAPARRRRTCSASASSRPAGGSVVADTRNAGADACRCSAAGAGQCRAPPRADVEKPAAQGPAKRPRRKAAANRPQRRRRPRRRRPQRRRPRRRSRGQEDATATANDRESRRRAIARGVLVSAPPLARRSTIGPPSSSRASCSAPSSSARRRTGSTRGGSSRPKPIVGQTILACHAAAGLRHAPSTCSGRRASRTSTSSTACTGASTRSRASEGHGERRARARRLSRSTASS